MPDNDDLFADLRPSIELDLEHLVRPRPSFDLSRPDLRLPPEDVQNGFMLFHGTDRIDIASNESIDLDLPIGESRFVPLSMLTLGKGPGDLAVHLEAAGSASRVFIERSHLIDKATADRNAAEGTRDEPAERRTLWDRFSTSRDGDDWSERRRDLAPAPEAPIRFDRELLRHRVRLWVEVSSQGLAADQRHELSLRLTIGLRDRTPFGLPRRRVVQRTVRFGVRVWPVDLRARREPFHMRGYNGGVMHWNAVDGGDAYVVSDTSLDDGFQPVLGSLRRIGGTVVDWTVHWPSLLPQVRIGSRSFRDAAPDIDLSPAEGFDEDAANDLASRLARMPRLDLSHYEPLVQRWLDAGIRQIDTQAPYVEVPEGGSPSDALGRLLQHTIGSGRVDPASGAARFLFVWLFSELRRFLGDRFEAGFCKISDEIAAEHVPGYIATAKLVRLAGWRPYTTVTGQLAVSSSRLAEFLPFCEQIQLNRRYLSSFHELLDERWSLVTESFDVDGPWGAYGNGGARRTWATACFGPDSVTEIDASEIDEFTLFQDGEPLPLRAGSPWGNHNPEGERRWSDVVITAGAVATHLYVSPSTGTPDDHTYHLKITRKVRDPAGRPLITLGPEHEIWFYAGASRPSRVAYETAYQNPILALHHDVRGFGWWAFYYWYEESRILERAEDGMHISPPYAGLHDGHRDAVLLDAVRERSRTAYDRIVGPRASASLRTGTEEIAARDMPVLLDRRDLTRANRARQRALRFLSR